MRRVGMGFAGGLAELKAAKEIRGDGSVEADLCAAVDAVEVGVEGVDGWVLKDTVVDLEGEGGSEGRATVGGVWGDVVG